MLVALPRQADAQIVNVQGALAKPPDKDGLTGQLELKLDWREGNTSFINVGGTASMFLRRGPTLGLAIVRGEYGRAGDGATFAKKTFEHLRVRHTLDRRWKWEMFGQHEYDAFRRLAIRAVAGTGPALQIVNEPRVSVLLGLAYLFELEQFDQRAGTLDAGTRFRNHRASLYVTGAEKLGRGVAVVQTFYAQPRIDSPSDLRLLGELAITSQLSKRIALTDGLTFSYDRTPPDGIKRYDLQLKIGILASF